MLWKKWPSPWHTPLPCADGLEGAPDEQRGAALALDVAIQGRRHGGLGSLALTGKQPPVQGQPGGGSQRAERRVGPAVAAAVQASSGRAANMAYRAYRCCTHLLRITPFVYALSAVHVAYLPANLPCCHEAARAPQHLHRSSLEHTSMGVSRAPGMSRWTHLQCDSRFSGATCTEET